MNASTFKANVKRLNRRIELAIEDVENGDGDQYEVADLRSELRHITFNFANGITY